MFTGHGIDDNREFAQWWRSAFNSLDHLAGKKKLLEAKTLSPRLYTGALWEFRLSFSEFFCPVYFCSQLYFKKKKEICSVVLWHLRYEIHGYVAIVEDMHCALQNGHSK